MEEDMKADRTLFQSCKAVIEQSRCTVLHYRYDIYDAYYRNIHTMSETLECLLDWKTESDDDG